MNQELDYSIKLLVLGDLSVGKTSFIYKFTENKFNEEQVSSAGLDLKTVDIVIESKKIRVQLWDTAGEEKYKSITKNLILRVNGILILFDITNKESFKNLSVWIRIINEFCGEDMAIIIIGNKRDLEERRTVPKEEASIFARKSNYKYIETSCKTGENIKRAIHNICRKVIGCPAENSRSSFSLDVTSLKMKKMKNGC